MYEIDLLSNELLKFWNWAGFSYVDYINQQHYGEWEIEYDAWDDLYKSVEIVINYVNSHNVIEDDIYLKLLEAMAIDNENERILELFKFKLKNYKQLLKIGSKNPSLQVRWQIVELLTQIDYSDRENLLIEMYEKEKEKYVIRRILLSLYKIQYSKTSEIALKHIKDEDEYIRLISLRILKDLKIPNLEEIFQIMKCDKSDLIQKEISC